MLDDGRGTTSGVHSPSNVHPLPLVQQSPDSTLRAGVCESEAETRQLASGELEKLMEEFSQRPGIQLAAVEMGIPGW